MEKSQRLEIEELFLANSSKLLRYLSLHTACREDAEDLLQDVFSNCCRYWERYDPQKINARAWLFVIARNRLKNYYRNRKQTVGLDELADSSLSLVDSDPSQEATYLMECREMLGKALAALAPRSRDIVILCYFGGRSTNEIAQQMNLSPGNVRVILLRAKRQMEQFLIDNEWEAI